MKDTGPINVQKTAVADWRRLLQINTRRTYFVIGSFMLIYILVGLLIDMFLYSAYYPNASVSQLFFALITFAVFPKATLIATLVALISLLVTFRFHDRLMLLGTEYHEITASGAQTIQEQQLYHVVEEMKVAAGLRYMPKVYLIEAPYMNAFATGYSEKSAMVAITRGLLEKLNRNELQAVMAHELSHVRHGDIKLTLMASVLTNLMLIMIDMLFYGMLFGGRRSDEEGRGRNQLVFIIFLLRWLLPLLTVLLMLYLSRTREYMADAGCVELTRDNEPLAHALLKIQNDYQANTDTYNQLSQQTAHESIRHAAYIFDPTSAGISGFNAVSDLFSTHPSLAKRLAALGFELKK